MLKVDVVLNDVVELHGLLHVIASRPIEHPLAARVEAENAPDIRGPGDQGLGLPGRHLVLEVHVPHGLGVGVEDGGAVAALETVLGVLLLHVSLQVGEVEVLVAETALDLVSARGSHRWLRPGALTGGHVGVPESDLREGEHLRAGATLPLVTVVNAGVHAGVAFPVLPQHGLAGVSVPGGGAIFTGHFPEVSGEDGECLEAGHVIWHVMLSDQVLLEVVQLIVLGPAQLTLELVPGHRLSHH